MNQKTDDILFETHSLLGGGRVRVYKNRVVIKVGFNQFDIPIMQVASVNIGFGQPTELETTGGKKYKFTVPHKKELREAIYKAQNIFTESQGASGGSNGGVAEELTKLAKLKEQGILSEKEFEDQKKKLLS